MEHFQVCTRAATSVTLIGKIQLVPFSGDNEATQSFEDMQG